LSALAGGLARERGRGREREGERERARERESERARERVVLCQIYAERKREEALLLSAVSGTCSLDPSETSWKSKATAKSTLRVGN